LSFWLSLLIISEYYMLSLNLIYGIGIDIVKISRIKDAIDRWGERFLDRLFTDCEKEYCQDREDAAARYALRFAAKEALSKALGAGMRRGVHGQQIEVINDSSGKPSFRLYGQAKAVCEEIEIRDSFLSLSDDGGYAVAMVVLETE
jgi:holo-[acyl-carrier protein] synthase